MHELSLCRSIFGIVERARDGRRVDSVHLQVGQLRQVVPETLEHCWGFVTEQTPLAGSRLQIEHVPVELLCASCGTVTTVADRLVLACGACGGGQVTVVRGEEFLLTTIDLSREESPVHG